MTNREPILNLLTPCILINLFSFTKLTKCTYVFSWFNTRKFSEEQLASQERLLHAVNFLDVAVMVGE